MDEQPDLQPSASTAWFLIILYLGDEHFCMAWIGVVFEKEAAERLHFRSLNLTLVKWKGVNVMVLDWSLRSFMFPVWF